MGFKFNKEELSGPKPVPPGLYTVKFEQFRPKKSKDGASINFNAEVSIVGGEYDGKRIFAGLNTKIPSWIQDFFHSFGVPMEDQNGEEPSIPGIFDVDKATFNAEDPTTWKYAGPIVGKTAQWEIDVKTYQGRDSNEPRQFICAIKDCASLYPQIRHARDMKSKD